MEFCEYWMNRINENPNVQNRILFSDEKTFYLNGTVNNQNTKIWARANPYICQETHTQWSQKVNLWAGILGLHVIGPFVIDGSLNGAKYLQLLNNKILPAVRRIAINGKIIFQQDGAPPHKNQEITRLLNIQFPNEWIGRFGPLKWPARSPNLNLLDFFYWEHPATKVFANIRDRPQDMQELTNRPHEASNEITVRQLQDVKRNFRDRLSYCLTAFGKQFEHLI
ncbi:DDE 3 domain containing protein [Asbolus verrucosus]|uniref:DDE 3 domain containing protein n=1 Tax=Asbolus verrucosus TaxID=1661398 RepID=A0A482VZ39_ASBVE|nr:DDE 3 domain containing protein [Asbolus verrucosus]